MKKRVLSVLMALSLMVGLMPMALAAETGLPTADENGVIKLTDNVTMTNVYEQTTGNITITADKPVTITANDKTDAFTVKGGTLTLGENVTITSNTSVLYADKGGKIVVDGATITSSSSIPVACVWNTDTNNTGSTLDVISGSIIATGTADGSIALVAEKNGVATISGGTVSSTSTSAVATNHNGTLTISGGTVTTTTTTDDAAAFAKNGGTLNVTGGTVSAPNTTKSFTLVAGAGGTVNVSGDAVVEASKSGAVLAHESETAEVTITGGTINGKVAAEAEASIEITGGTFTGEDVNIDDYLVGGLEVDPETGKVVAGELEKATVEDYTGLGQAYTITGIPGMTYTIQTVTDDNYISITSITLPEGVEAFTVSVPSGADVQIWETDGLIVFGENGAPTTQPTASLDLSKTE